MSHIQAVTWLDTRAFAESLPGHIKEFDEITLRQDAPGSPHKDTRAIFLRGPSASTPEAAVRAWFDDVAYTDYGNLLQWPEALDLVDDILLQLPSAAVGKIMLVELKAGGALAWHIDEGDYAKAYRRFHLPIVTNPMAFMYTGGDQAHLPVGVLTEFDTSVLHSAINAGPAPRIHLILDVRR